MSNAPKIDAEVKQQFMSQLHHICGYIEAGEGDVMRLWQDDATGDWCLSVGKKAFHGASVGHVFDQALKDANEYWADTYGMTAR